MDLYAHCLFYAAHLGTIEKQHGSKPTSEPVVKEIREGECEAAYGNGDTLSEHSGTVKPKGVVQAIHRRGIVYG
jgi:hypothetical protein